MNVVARRVKCGTVSRDLYRTLNALIEFAEASYGVDLANSILSKV